MKILILALSGIGDALMFTPAIQLLRKEYPKAEIDALVMIKGVEDMYIRNPNLNKVIHIPFISIGIVKSLVAVAKLRRAKYDIALNVYPSNRKEYNIINFMIGAKRRGAVKYLRKDKENLGFLNNIRVTENDQSHNVTTNLRLLEKLFQKQLTEEPPLSFYLTDEDSNYASEYLQTANISHADIVVGFHPGSALLKNHINRRWEPDKFVSLGKQLINDFNAKVLLFGGPEESDLKSKIVNEINSPKSFEVNTKNLAYTAAVMKRCNIFVSNDSSLMHVASSLGLKVVAIIGPTNPAYIHPWKTEHAVVSLNLECAPCFIYSPRPLICFRNDLKFKCIKELTVPMVYTAVKQLLG